MQDFKKLKVWEKSMEFVTEVYKVTKNFPHDEQYGLSNQMRRAAVSIPANIAEGSSRRTSKDFLSFLRISLGSSHELLTYIEISKNLNYIDIELKESLNKDLELIKVMLIQLMKRIYQKTI